MAAVPPTQDNQGTPTRPYLLRALHEWCSDNGFTPYLAVYVDGSVQVPMEYVKNNEIVLNVGLEATSSLRLGNDFIEFKARFGGVAREIIVPVDHVIAIYARENGQGMAFPAPTESAGAGAAPVMSRPTAVPPAGLRLATGGDANSVHADAARPNGPTAVDTQAGSNDGEAPEPPDTPTPAGRPSLKRVK